MEKQLFRFNLQEHWVIADRDVINRQGFVFAVDEESALEILQQEFQSQGKTLVMGVSRTDIILM